jgi:hypothetical protein
MKQEHTTDLITDIQSVAINFDEQYRRRELCKNERRAIDWQFYQVNHD